MAQIYLLGMLITFLYILVQLILTLPEDVREFMRLRYAGALHEEEDCVIMFLCEVFMVCVLLILFFPVFWFFEIRRFINERYNT